MNTPAIMLQLLRNNPNLQAARQMLGMVRCANNPQAMLSTLIQRNPQLQQVMNIIQQSGGDPDKALCAACEQKGINPQDIYDLLK